MNKELAIKYTLDKIGNGITFEQAIRVLQLLLKVKEDIEIAG